MIYYQDWAETSSNFEPWVKEKVFWSVNYTTDSPEVWPTFSITASGYWCSDESCHRQYLRDALLIAANSGKEAIAYEPRTVSMFYYNQWGKVEWDRLQYSLSTANNIIATGTAAPTPSPDPNDCTHFVPCGYTFYPGKESPGYEWGGWNSRNIPLIAIDCDADPGCIAFNSDGLLKWLLEEQWSDLMPYDPCLGLYVKTNITAAPSHLPSSSPTKNPSTPNPTNPPSPAPSKSPTESPEVPTTSSPTSSPTKNPSSTPSPTSPPSLAPSTAPTGSPVTPPPTDSPTKAPSSSPTTPNPTYPPTFSPSKSPTPPPAPPPTYPPMPPPTPPPTGNCPYAVPNGYDFHPHMDSAGYDWGPFNSRNIPAIANDCDADSGCIAFNSNGWLKWHVLPEAQWNNWTTDPCLGLYVKTPITAAPSPLPTSSPTKNPVSSTPNPTSPPSLAPSKAPTGSPVTQPPTDSPTTAPSTKAPSSSPTTPNPTSPPTFLPSKSPTSPPTPPPPTGNCPYAVPNGYDFYPNKDSPGYAWGQFNWRNIPAIANDCNADANCIAFNSNGWLKWCIFPEAQWDTWGEPDPCLGFYVKQGVESGLVDNTPCNHHRGNCVVELEDCCSECCSGNEGGNPKTCVPA